MNSQEDKVHSSKSITPSEFWHLHLQRIVWWSWIRFCYRGQLHAPYVQTPFLWLTLLSWDSCKRWKSNLEWVYFERLPKINQMIYTLHLYYEWPVFQWSFRTCWYFQGLKHLTRTLHQLVKVQYRRHLVVTWRFKSETP